VCSKDASGASGACEVFSLMTAARLGSGQCPAWKFGNAGALGYYRTAYNPELLRSLSANAETALSAPERVSLVGDEWALVQAGHDSAANFLDLAAGFGREPIAGVLDEVTTGLAYVRTYLTSAATKAPFEAFVRGLFRPQFADMGISAAATDTDDRRELRPVVVETLGTAGNDADVVAQARAALDAALAGRASLDPTAASAIVTVAASHGDRALWDALSTAARRATSPADQYRYLYALGDFTDPALIRLGLDEVLSPNVRTQNAGRYLSEFLRNPAARQMAWTFLKEHWKDLEPKLSIAFADVGVVQALGSFCDAGSRDDVRTFFAAHKLGNAARNVDQTIERIDNCIARREKQAPAVAEWLRLR
jgi:puromycin-sensitive aminopeptidase